MGEQHLVIPAQCEPLSVITETDLSAVVGGNFTFDTNVDFSGSSEEDGLLRTHCPAGQRFGYIGASGKITLVNWRLVCMSSKWQIENDDSSESASGEEFAGVGFNIAYRVGCFKGWSTWER